MWKTFTWTLPGMRGFSEGMIGLLIALSEGA